MKKAICGTLVNLSVLVLFQFQASAGQFHFSGGVTFANGIYKVVDKMETLYKSAGYSFDRNLVFPVGLSLNPYYEWASGFGVGLDVGPTAIIAIDQTTYGSWSYSSSVEYSYIVPVGADVRYTFFRHKTFSPYLRAGVRYPIVGGQNLDSSDVGAFGAAGVELWRTQSVGMGIEVGYDSSKVTVKGPMGRTGSAHFPGLTASLFVRF